MWGVNGLDPGFKLVMTCNSTIHDGSFNSKAWSGILLAQKDPKVPKFNPTYASPCPAPTEEEMDVWISEDNVVHVIFAGYNFLELFVDISDKYAKTPGIHFSIIDSYVDPSCAGASNNAQCIVFAEEQGGFIVGNLAGMVSKSKSVLFVGGAPFVTVNRYLTGFELGVRYACPSCTVYSQTIYSFTAGQEGKEVVDYYINNHEVDVVFGAGGLTCSEAIIHAANSTSLVYVIGVDGDEFVSSFKNGNVSGANRLLTSSMKRIDISTSLAVQEDLDGEFRAGRVMLLDYSNEGVALSNCHEACGVVHEYQMRLDFLESAIAIDNLEIGVRWLTGRILPSEYFPGAGATPNVWEKLISFSAQPPARLNHAATVLVPPGEPSPVMWVFGGAGSSATLSDLWSYNTGRGSWQPHTLQNLARGPWPGARHHHTLTGFQGVLVLYGGRLGASRYSSVWILTPATFWYTRDDALYDVWTEIQPARGPDGRELHTASAIDGLGVLIFAGRSQYEVLADCWLFLLNSTNLAKSSWKQLAPAVSSVFPEARTAHAAAVVGETVYILGGLSSKGLGLNDLWKGTVLLSSTVKWSRLADFPAPALSGHSFTPSFLARPDVTTATEWTILVAVAGQISDSQANSQIWVFSVENGTWAMNPSLSAPLFSKGQVAVSGAFNSLGTDFSSASSPATIFVHGGLVNGSVSGEAWIYPLMIPSTCDAVLCSLHGNCSALNGTAVCLCEIGYVGADCQFCNATARFNRTISGTCEQQSFIEISNGVFWTVIVLAILAACFDIYLLALVVKNRKSSTMKVSQWQYMALIAGGGLVSACSLFAIVAAPRALWCSFDRWAQGISFWLILGVFFSKTKRVVRIFRAAKHLRSRRITLVQVLRPLLTIGALQGFLLVSQQLLSPPYIEERTSSFSIVRVCTSQHETESTVLQLMLEGVLMSWGLLLGYQVWRDVSEEEFRDGKEIVIAIYNYVIVQLLTRPLIWMLHDDPNIRAVLMLTESILSAQGRRFVAILLTASYAGSIAIFFFPKVLRLLVLGGGGKQKLPLQSASASQNSVSRSGRKRFSMTRLELPAVNSIAVEPDRKVLQAWMNQLRERLEAVERRLASLDEATTTKNPLAAKK